MLLKFFVRSSWKVYFWGSDGDQIGSVGIRWGPLGSIKEFLEDFETLLEQNNISGQLQMLNFAFTTKAKDQTVTLTRPYR